MTDRESIQTTDYRLPVTKLCFSRMDAVSIKFHSAKERQREIQSVCSQNLNSEALTLAIPECQERYH